MMPLTPLQSLLGFDYLPPHWHGIVEFLIVNIAVGAAVALRRRKTVFTASGFMILGLGALIDLFAVTVAPTAKIANSFAAAGMILFLWGIIRLIMDAVEFSARRVRRDFSTILRDLISLSL